MKKIFVYIAMSAVIWAAGVPDPATQPTYHEVNTDYVYVDNERLLDCFLPERKSTARQVLDRIYTVPMEQLAFHNGQDFGFSMPCNPEFLLPLLLCCQGKDIFIAGAARGEIGILFALAGASRVIINDINPQLLNAAKEYRDTFKASPFFDEIQSKIKESAGDCIEEMNALSEKSIDIVVACNVMHFLTAAQLKLFGQAVNRITRTKALFYAANDDISYQQITAFSSPDCYADHVPNFTILLFDYIYRSQTVTPGLMSATAQGHSKSAIACKLMAMGHRDMIAQIAAFFNTTAVLMVKFEK